jgi:hypothetical protein
LVILNFIKFYADLVISFLWLRTTTKSIRLSVDSLLMSCCNFMTDNSRGRTWKGLVHWPNITKILRLKNKDFSSFLTIGLSHNFPFYVSFQAWVKITTCGFNVFKYQRLEKMFLSTNSINLKCICNMQYAYVIFGQLF